jgi:hypothetical protein
MMEKRGIDLILPTKTLIEIILRLTQLTMAKIFKTMMTISIQKAILIRGELYMMMKMFKQL